MALIPCPECGKDISDKAFSCPSCGCPIAKRVVAPPQSPPLQIESKVAVVERHLPSSTSSSRHVSDTQPAAPPSLASTVKCNTCGSGEMRKLEMIWSQGKSTSWNIASLGFGKSQNELSKLCNPPSKPYEPSGAAMKVVSFVVIPVIGLALTFVFPPLFFMVLMGPIMYFIGPHKKQYIKDLAKYESEYAEYSRKWMCLKCGNIQSV